MSKSVLGTVLSIASFALMFVPGVGTALGIGMQIGLGTLTVAQIVGVGLMVAGNMLIGPAKPKAMATSPTDRLTATLNPTAPRKIAFGHSALACDVRYQAFTGGNQEYLEQIICVASHKVAGIEQLWLDSELAWNSTAGAVGRYKDFVTVTPVLEGTASNGIAIDGNWTAHATLTGCAYLHVKFLLIHQASDGSNDSPFAGGVTSRMTIRGKGALTYDPRLDSTVAGGSGPMRAGDQTTWAWDDNASCNPALQELFYELGWTIAGKLAVGKGLPPARIDLASYAVAANACDEAVALAAGGSEPRYRAGGVVSEDDDPGAVRDNLCASMNAQLRDSGGRLALVVIHDDLATPVTPAGKAAFDADDVLGEMQWDQTPSLEQTFNIIRGRRIDGSDIGLYQPVDFPEVKLASPDGIDRIASIDFQFVESNGQAQRLAKQRLQRGQYQGRLSFTGGPAWWGVSLGDVFALTHPALGWEQKLLRCVGQKIRRSGETDIVAVEEHPDIYRWDNDEQPAVSPGAPTVYDPLNDALVGGLIDAVNRWIGAPPQSLTFAYDYQGVAQAGELPRTIGPKFLFAGGQITSGIAWSGLVLSGTLNGTLTSASGPFDLGTGATPALTVSDLGATDVKLQVTATYRGKDYSLVLDLVRQQAPAPVSSGGGSSGGPTTVASKSSGFTSISTTSFVDVTGAIAGTMPAGKTTANVAVNLSVKPFSGIGGSWTIEVKAMRDVGGTPTQIGTTQSAQSTWNAADGVAEPAGFSFTVADSGLTAGASYSWRVYARLVSGSRTHSILGSVVVTA